MTDESKEPASKEPADKESTNEESAGKASASKASASKGSAGKASASKESAGKASASKTSAGKASGSKESAGKEPAGKASASKTSAGKASASKASASKGSASKGGAEARTAKEVELAPEFFGAKVNVPLIHQVVVAQLAAARQGTHKTKTRGEVRGGGRKPYRQKGTGRARQGSIRAPQFTGGGVVHGPVPRSYAQRTPKKMKAAALRGALSDRANHGRVHVVPHLIEEEKPKTKVALAALREVTEAEKVLVVVDRGDELTFRSLRNVPEVHLLHVDQLNAYDVLCSDEVVFTESAYQVFVGKEDGE